MVIVENEYFDLDFRSEFSKVHDARFGSRSSDTARVHFFNGRIPKSNSHLRDFVARRGSTYYGYAVLRPQFPGKIGRSMVSSELTVAEIAGDRTLADKVRTAVGEDVQIFGVAQRVVGVPFMEQDGHLMTCAHITAWVCHYSAVLRGAVPRRASAQFHGISDKTAAFSRSYPSQGLNRNMLTATLRAVDLPPEVLDADSLCKRINLNWSHRLSFTAETRQLEAEANRLQTDANRIKRAGVAIALQRLWVGENLGACVCRYLNSALPVILLRAPEQRSGVAHAQVAVGYLRRQDLDPTQQRPKSGEEYALDDATSDVVALIVCDDQTGPYQVVMLEELVNEFVHPDKSRQASVVVPLPRSIWLSGTAAEQAAADWLKVVAEDRLGALASWRLPRRLVGHANLYHERLRSFVDQISGERIGELAIRTYITAGTEFKESIARRLNGEKALARALGYTQMPKYVWVSEAIDRKLRDKREPSVLATIAFDSTAVTIDGRLDTTSLLPLVVHIPGQAVCSTQYDDYAQSDVNQGWFPSALEPYRTGRWNRHSDNHDYTRRHWHWKSAMSFSAG
ncbi:hypothetical protein [Nocardia sp. CA-119907]|uniref:hypothetical protein n=1 Tax=Nocardia sp. CA-119907 TaxID=3239973 RepID=UPI003D97EFB1